MNVYLRLVTVSAITVAGAPLAASAVPQALSQAQSGLWEVVRPGAGPVKLCLANPSSLAQIEHRGANCSGTVVKDSGTTATITYTCPGGGFGQSQLKLVTPRSMRVETQGIARNAPFSYTFQARRVGDCPAR